MISNDGFDSDDLMAFLNGVQGAVGTVIKLTRDKAFKSYLTMWVYVPLEKILKEWKNHEGEKKNANN